MDRRLFDDLTRAASETRSRRTALGLVAGAALSAALTQINLLAAKKRKNKNKKKKCRKFVQGCGGKKKKCCQGLFCVDGACGCQTGQILSGGKCINPEPPECDADNDCGANEVCDDGTCFCPLLELGGECVFPCETTSDCPGECNSCLGAFPNGQPRVVCVEEPFLLCSDAIACDQVDECPPGFICAFVDCGDGDGRCYPITCNG